MINSSRVELKDRMSSRAVFTKLRSFTWSFVRGTLIWGTSLIIVYPVIFKVLVSFMSETDLFDPQVNLLTRNFSIARIARSYMAVANTMQYMEAFLNSLGVCLLVSGCTLISSTLIGYGFARFNFKINSLLFAFVVLTLVVPPQMNMIPLFLNFRFFDFYGLLSKPGFNLIGTVWPFLFTSLTGTGYRNGLFIYIMRQHFAGMPKSLEEAAYIDGAGALKTFIKIMLPGAIPVLIVVFLFSFVWQWNDTFLTSLYMRDTSTLLPFTLNRLVNEFDFDNFDKLYATVVRNTGMVLFLAPLLIMYGFLQRYFVEGIERTGIVG